MIKANKHDVEIKGKVDDLVSELTAAVHGFIEELSKDNESIDDSSLLFRSFLFYIQKDAESHGLDTKITKDEMKDFEKKYKESREMADKFAELLDGLLKALEGSDDDEDSDSDDDDGVIGMCAIPANSKKGKAIMDILGIKPKDTKDDDETEDDIPDFLF